MTERSALEVLRPLMQDERIKAMQNAQNAVRASYGEQPERERFVHEYASKHPQGVRRTITVLCIIVLIAAFALSAMRLYYIGSQTFGASIADAPSIVVAGIATVLLAEAAQLVSTLALAAFGETRTARAILYLTAFGATCIALVGNGQVALADHANSLFAYLDAFVPPLLVLGIGHILKYQWLHSIEQMHEVNQQYRHAVAEWQIQINADPTKHPDWMMFYANALRDQILKAHARSSTVRAMLPQFDASDWRALVQRELEQERWYAIPPAPVRVTKPEAPALPSRNGKGVTGTSTDEVLNAFANAYQGEDSLLHLHCPHCNTEFSNATEKGLRLALTAHLRRCEKRNGEHL